MSNQFGRKATLIVSTGTVGLDLSDFRFRFHTENSDAQTPNTLYVRIYNLSQQTIAKIGTNTSTEFSTITLQAGYESGNYGVIFSGEIKQTAKGKENSTDTFLDIWAADGDAWYNWAVISRSISSGQTPQQVIESIQSAPSVNGAFHVPFASDASGVIAGGAAGVPAALARGKSMFGLARDYARDWASKYGYRWSIQNGEFTVVQIDGYRPGQAVVLSSTTGLVGIPELTEQGLRARALLNPLIRIGCLVQIAKSDINQITSQQQGLRYDAAIANVATGAGFYRVLQAKFSGDTRGNDFYVDIIGLAVDVSAPNQNQSVATAG